MAPPGPTPPGPTRAHRHRRPDTRGGSSHGPLEWTWSQEGLAPRMRTGWPSAANSFAPVSRSRHWIPSRDSKNAIDDQLQDTTSVLEAFHIVKLAGDAPGEVRRRVQQDTTGNRGRTGDPLYPGPQSLARLAPQAHPMPTRTTPRGPLWGCVPSSSGLYRLFHVPSPSRHSRCSRGIVPLTGSS